MWLLSRTLASVRIAYDRFRSRTRRAPSESQTAPTDNDHPYADITPPFITEDNQEDAAARASQSPYAQKYWRERFRRIYQKLPRAEVWLALFTFVLVIETAISIRILTTTDAALNRLPRPLRPPTSSTSPPLDPGSAPVWLEAPRSVQAKPQS